MKAAIYRRISTSGQEDGSSLEVQEDACRAYAVERGYEVVADYTDIHSGMDLWFRPKVQEVLNDAESGRFNVLIVHKADRLARDADHRAFLRVQLERHGVGVESVLNPRENTFAGRIVDDFQARFSEYEVEVIQKRMADGRKHRVEVEHRLPAGGHPLFGYQYDDPAKAEKNRYVEDESNSWVVRRIYQEAAAGVPLRRIAIGLNEDGITTMKGKQWHARQVSRLLANPTYKGRVYANRHKVVKDKRTGRKIETLRPESEWFEIPGQLAPALVDDVTWAAANDVLHRNRAKVAATRPYDEAEDALLRAGHVYCAFCGHRMAVNRRRGKVSYKCQSVYQDPNTKCRGWGIEAGKLDEWVWNHTLSWLADPGVLAFELERSRPAIIESTAEEVEGLKRGLAQIEAEQASLVQTLGRLTGSAVEPVVKRLNNLGSNRDALVARLGELDRLKESASRVERVESEFWDSVLEYAAEIEHWDYQRKREALKRLGVRVTVAKQGKGRARFWIEVVPPWPREVEWEFWKGCGDPANTFDTGSEGIAVADLSKSVYAAYQRTQTLAEEQESSVNQET